MEKSKAGEAVTVDIVVEILLEIYMELMLLIVAGIVLYKKHH